MLHDNKDMPKFQTITDEKSIEKYGGIRMYFAPPIARIAKFENRIAVALLDNGNLISEDIYV